MVAAFASRGYNVIGVDINEEFVKAINNAKPPVFEPMLEKFLVENKERISATTDYEKAILNSEITFIIVPTPSMENGNFSTKYVENAGESIGKALKKKESYHLVVLTSTVTPTSTEKYLLPVLEKNSGKKCGKDFGLCYNPEFIALGNVINGLLYPDFCLIGEFDKKSGDILENFYRKIYTTNVPIKRMNIVNAEITKISLNTFVTTKISYANMISELCEKIPNADVDIVTDALGCDTRIGHKYLKGATGYGGPCFPRDNRALIYTAKNFGVDLPIAKSTDEINKNQVKRLKEKILEFLPKNGVVGILGVSYKPDTNVIEESQGIKVAEILIKENIPVVIYDPAANENAKKVLGKANFASSAKECIENSDVIAILTPWEEFKNIKEEWFENDKVVIDAWRILNFKNNKVKYIAIGRYSKK